MLLCFFLRIDVVGLDLCRLLSEGFTALLLKEYELSEVFNFAEDDRKYETVKTQTHLEAEHDSTITNNELSASIERERQSEITAQPTSVTERDRIRSRLLAKMNPGYNNNSNAVHVNGNIATAANIVPKNDKNAIMQNIANSYHRTETSYNATSAANFANSAATIGWVHCRNLAAARNLARSYAIAVSVIGPSGRSAAKRAASVRCIDIARSSGMASVAGGHVPRCRSPNGVAPRRVAIRRRPTSIGPQHEGRIGSKRSS
ncbi:unnamed protein product [Ceratitis capitata]|uniref:(Mediterranean fruit fly) hypothetical protein n=1 Tax=Ceratitis capitata TaxID=7213 RepID=A0A811UHA3_CERCA|nr:unnamed protein product [Ceratitis capitata]